MTWWKKWLFRIALMQRPIETADKAVSQAISNAVLEILQRPELARQLAINIRSQILHGILVEAFGEKEAQTWILEISERREKKYNDTDRV